MMMNKQTTLRLGTDLNRMWTAAFVAVALNMALASPVHADGMGGDGFVNLPRVRRDEGRYDKWSKSSRRICGDVGEFAPCNESGGELLAIK